MGNKKISETPNASTLTGDEIIPLVQNGQNVKTTVNNFAATAPKIVSSDDIDSIVVLSQAQYDALDPPEPRILYIIRENAE